MYSSTSVLAGLILILAGSLRFVYDNDHLWCNFAKRKTDILHWDDDWNHKNTKLEKRYDPVCRLLRHVYAHVDVSWRQYIQSDMHDDGKRFPVWYIVVFRVHLYIVGILLPAVPLFSIQSLIPLDDYTCRMYPAVQQSCRIRYGEAVCLYMGRKREHIDWRTD